MGHCVTLDALVVPGYLPGFEGLILGLQLAVEQPAQDLNVLVELCTPGRRGGRRRRAGLCEGHCRRQEPGGEQPSRCLRVHGLSPFWGELNCAATRAATLRVSFQRALPVNCRSSSRDWSRANAWLYWVSCCPPSFT